MFHFDSRSLIKAVVYGDAKMMEAWKLRVRESFKANAKNQHLRKKGCCGN